MFSIQKSKSDSVKQKGSSQQRASYTTQPKSEVGAEANRLADQVMLTPQPRPTCPCGGGCPNCLKQQGEPSYLQTMHAETRDSGAAVAQLIRLTAAPIAIYRQALVEPPIVTQFREVGQLVPPERPEMTALRNQPVNVSTPAVNSEQPAPSTTPQPAPASGPSPQIIYFLMRHEGFYAHPDDVSDPYNCTVGYGILLHHGTCVGNENPAERRFARGITPEQGLSRLVSRVVRVANNLRGRLSVPLSPNQFDALLSFAFNTGGLANLLSHVNRGEYQVIPGIMLQYTGARTDEGEMAHPRGVATRRNEEVAIWERGDYGHGRPRIHHGCRRMIEDCTDREHPRPRTATSPEQH
jgi:GH24 family phage-related lysozyme (muramidase)